MLEGSAMRRAQWGHLCREFPVALPCWDESYQHASRYVQPGDDGKVKDWESSSGKVSVLQIARAVVSQAVCVEPRLA
jgi:hypothetical protein